MNNKNQFVCFLSGAGGTGKSRVINGVRHYCKLLCNELGVEFTKRTIVITAVTGSAAVTIHGETMHSACGLCSRKRATADDDWKNTVMVVVDEISFITRNDFEKLNDVLNKKTNSKARSVFGNIQIVFAGDFCQLKPPQVGSYPLFVYKDCDLWYHKVNTFLELQTNHCFSHDREWGELLQPF